MLRRFIVSLFIVVPLALAGCATFPDLEGDLSNRATNADYPRLVPFEMILGQVDGAPNSRRAAADLDARAATLRRRAAALRGPVLDAATRQRLLAAVSRHR